jgi:hypothetical protein
MQFVTSSVSRQFSYSLTSLDVKAFRDYKQNKDEDPQALCFKVTLSNKINLRKL